MTDQSEEQSKVPMPGLFFNSWIWKDPSVFIKRAATRSVILKGLGLSQQAYRWKNNPSIHCLPGSKMDEQALLASFILNSG